MHTVAVLTQTLRTPQCLAFLESRDGQYHGTILLGNIGVVASAHVPKNFGAQDIRRREKPLPSAALATTKARALVLAWAQGGSTVGKRIEKVTKGVLWRLRYVDRISIIRRIIASNSKKQGEVSVELFGRLREIQQHERIDEVIVFDLYDLPTAVKFGEEFGVVVLVR